MKAKGYACLYKIATDKRKQLVDNAIAFDKEFAALIRARGANKSGDFRVLEACYREIRDKYVAYARECGIAEDGFDTMLKGVHPDMYELLKLNMK